jgi:hypothetical protein
MMEDVKEEIRSELTFVKKEIGEVWKLLRKVHLALVGSDIGKDGGLVDRVISGEKECAELAEQVKLLEERQNKRFELLEKEMEKKSVYIMIIWGCGGVFLSAIAIAIINNFTK